ncbi:isocitrate dehydrogenase, partial [Striga asiatica]
PGRPKKLRRRQPNESPTPSSETRLKKLQNSVKFGKCGKQGHNSRTCKNQQSESRTPVARSMSGTHSQSQSKSHLKLSLNLSLKLSLSITLSLRKDQSYLRRRESATVGGVNLSGGTNRVSSINMMQSSSGTEPIIVKGGVNYITLSNLRAVAAAQGTPKQNEGQKSI